MNEEQLEPAPWPGGPRICRKSRMLAFGDRAEAKKFFDSLPAITVDDSYECVVCGGWHVESHCREPSGASSGKSIRPLNVIIPRVHVEGNKKLSQRDTEQFANLEKEPTDETPTHRRSRKRNPTPVLQNEEGHESDLRGFQDLDEHAD